MNKKHVSKVGRYISVACLLLVCTIVQSCRDEYFYDDREPDFIGSSIYDYLKSQGNFEHFLKVVDDLKYGEVLQRTGSKTLFVADDTAFMKGIEEEWGIKDTAQLTAAHKRLILNSAMLDNAYLLEMLSKLPSADSYAEPTPGQCLRRVTSAVVTDTIPVFLSTDLPTNNKHWANLRKNNGGIRLALDATQTLMTHFTEELLYQKNITETDLGLLVGREGEAKVSDIYIFDKKVLREKSDVTCKNGYVHQLDGLLIPPSNIAEEIRKHDNLTIFNRVLDRFSAPVPIGKTSKIAEDFNRIYNFGGEPVQLYEKRYFTEQTARGAAGDFLSFVDEKDTTRYAEGSLLFDPGWNSYRAGSAMEHDMAAVFAPTDKAMTEYFTQGSGKELVLRYGANVKDPLNPNGGLLEAMDSIPLDVIQALVRNHMQASFINTVPSKFDLIVNDARDPLGVTKENVEEYVLANNGVIYMVNSVYSPARYVAVIAPVMLSEELAIFNEAIEKLGYDRYLLSMGNKFGLIVTENDGMVYYDPKTEKKLKDRIAYKFTYNPADSKNPIKAQAYKYDHNTYNPETNTYAALEKDNGAGNVDNLFKEILEYNIVLDEMDAPFDCENRRKYYMSKGYGAVKVSRNSEGKVNAIAGGREILHKAMVPVVKTFEQENGQTYQLATMVQPPTQTVFDVLSTASEFEEFFELCVGQNDDVFDYLGITSEQDNEATRAKKIKPYKVFDGKPGEENVWMFDTYHYTVYVPSNEAMNAAYGKGLWTWTMLDEERKALEELKKAADALTDKNEKAAKLAEIELRKAAMRENLDLMIKFIRYHFQDNSVFVDNVRHSVEVDAGDGEKKVNYVVTYETAALNDSTNRFSSVTVQTAEDHNKTISVTGNITGLDNTCYVMNSVAEDEGRLYNVMTRDFKMVGTTETSSYAVVHQIDGFLVYGGNGGIYNVEKDRFEFLKE